MKCRCDSTAGTHAGDTTNGVVDDWTCHAWGSMEHHKSRKRNSLDHTSVVDTYILKLYTSPVARCCNAFLLYASSIRDQKPGQARPRHDRRLAKSRAARPGRPCPKPARPEAVASPLSASDKGASTWQLCDERSPWPPAPRRSGRNC